MPKYDYDYEVCKRQIQLACLTLHEEGYEIAPDEFQEKFISHQLFEQIQSLELCSKLIKYYRKRAQIREKRERGKETD